MLSGKDWEIWRSKEDNSFHAWQPGWFSPRLSVIGGWNLARQVDVTPEKFEREFGINPKGYKIELTISEFVQLFYRNGELPISISASRDPVIDQVYDSFLEDLDYSVEEEEFSEEEAKAIKKHSEKIYNFFTSSKTPDAEIFKNIKPFFDDFSSIAFEGNKVIINDLYNFIEECDENKAEWVGFLYESFWNC